VTLVGLGDLILGEVRLGHGVVNLVGLGDFILGEVRLGHGKVNFVGLGDKTYNDKTYTRQNVYTTKRIMRHKV